MLSVPELLEKKNELFGSEVSVQGFFLHDGTRAFLLDDESDSVDLGVQIKHSGLLKVLFSTVPAYGGGKYLYKDGGEVTGTLRSVGDHFFLENLTYMMMNCDGEDIQVI